MGVRHVVKIQSPLARGDLRPFWFRLGNFIAAITQMSMGRSWLPCLMMTGQAQEDPARMLMSSREISGSTRSGSEGLCVSDESVFCSSVIYKLGR
jgi:hypothetical protein